MGLGKQTITDNIFLWKNVFQTIFGSQVPGSLYEVGRGREYRMEAKKERNKSGFRIMPKKELWVWLLA